ncbi:hypothetical protein V1478_015468 [Vespula squamosa]|uniref:Uncharacterized protein n=1 Tax=Vespula squamosa TaxID=30214 RepID=A0ABD2A580_VESSQ
MAEHRLDSIHRFCHVLNTAHVPVRERSTNGFRESSSSDSLTPTSRSFFGQFQDLVDGSRRAASNSDIRRPPESCFCRNPYNYSHRTSGDRAVVERSPWTSEW